MNATDLVVARVEADHSVVLAKERVKSEQSLARDTENESGKAEHLCFSRWPMIADDHAGHVVQVLHFRIHTGGLSVIMIWRGEEQPL